MTEISNKINSFSHRGQDIIALSWLRKIGFLNKVAVEFGARNGFQQSNIRMFEKLNWKLYQWDKFFQNKFVNKESITAENINQIFEKYEVPKQFDFLSIDIDSNDYWVWKALNYEANLVLIEYNPNFSIDKSVALKYDPNRVWKKNVAFSASFSDNPNSIDFNIFFRKSALSFKSLVLSANGICAFSNAIGLVGAISQCLS